VLSIFNVLESMGANWTVFSDTVVTPSLTRAMFPELWDPFLDGHFQGFPSLPVRLFERVAAELQLHRA
jgi:phospholipase C